MKRKPKSKPVKARPAPETMPESTGRKIPTAPLFPCEPLFVRFLPEGLACVPGMPGPVVNLLTDLQQTKVAHCTEGDLIRFRCDRFARERDPLDLLWAVVLSVKLGVYPPVSLLHTVSDAFQTVLHSEGGTTLDTALGLSGSKGGVWKAVTRRKKRTTIIP